MSSTAPPPPGDDEPLPSNESHPSPSPQSEGMRQNPVNEPPPSDERKLSPLARGKREFERLGGWQAFKSGEWIWLLIQKSFRNYWERGTAEYFQEKYGTTDPEKIAPKLIAVAAKNAALLGAGTGAVVSADEIIGIATGAEVGLGLPANIAIAVAAMGGEAIALVHFQLQLVANLGRAYGVSLDPDDPEDILTILWYALGGGAGEGVGKFGMKVGGKLAGRMAKAVFKKEVLAFCKSLAAKVGIKILQRTIVKYTIPIASMAIGSGWNYFSTRTVGHIAIRHFKKRLSDGEPADKEPAPPPPPDDGAGPASEVVASSGGGSESGGPAVAEHVAPEQAAG
jgi:uncharacterized protein (DUF697 family)